jgi:serine/threonine protein kinase
VECEFNAVLQALVYLHGHNFAHRDLKPANAMLALQEDKKRASVKLVDFSLCHDMSGGPQFHAVGTLVFMPPEMVARDAHDCSCDVWSLGVTVVFLLAEKGPWKCPFDALFVPSANVGVPQLAQVKPPRLPRVVVLNRSKTKQNRSSLLVLGRLWRRRVSARALVPARPSSWNTSL